MLRPPRTGQQERNGPTAGRPEIGIIVSITVRSVVTSSPCWAQTQTAAGLERLGGDGNVCDDERAAVGRALDPQVSVERGEPVCQPEEPASLG
jgi:hypothetical protein